ncbi:MAG: protein kinase [Vicinamibacteria bacterium]|nr:protein kinase [Vicinamibacteria bacterium]
MKRAKLGREVAIKVLPAAFAQDAERVARFRREAQILASLNHPNIAAIHGLEESEGTLALVMELVDGEDLAARLKRGAIPVDEAIAIARQIAEALEEAHEKGIVHRGCSPFWSPDGKWIGFFASGKLYKVPAAGGSPQALADAPRARGGTWNARGEILFTPASFIPIQRTTAAGGGAAPVAASATTATGRSQMQELHSYAHFLPDGRRFLFSRGGGIAVGDLDSGEVKEIAPTCSASHSTPGAWSCRANRSRSPTTSAGPPRRRRASRSACPRPG